MRSADGDEDACLPDFEPAEAVDDGHAVDGKLAMELGADLAHLGKRHGFVSLIFEKQGAAAGRVVADAAIEGDDGAVVIGADETRESRWIDRFVDDAKNVLLTGCDRWADLSLR